MTREFENIFSTKELGTRIRAILGVPEEILDNSVISSPTFKVKADNYINKKISNYTEEQLAPSFELLDIAYLYYIAYLLCTGMVARLPKQMENVSIPSIDMAITFENLASKNLEKYCAIFIGGGNTYKLLKGLKDSGAFNKIQEYINNNGLVVGCSAGAVICGKDIEIISSMDPNEVNLTDTKGFDVMSGVSIFPHYINLKSKLTDKENQSIIDKYTNSIIEFTQENGEVLAIPEEDTIYIDENSIEVIVTKKYYYFNKNKKQEFEI